MLNSKLVAGLLLGLVFSGASHGASISYYLDQSDKLSDGTNYLRVTISDGLSGAVNFSVEALQPLLDLAADTGFGIVKFAFNAVPGIPLNTRRVDISTLPFGWSKGPNQQMNGFGKYDMRLRVTRARTPRTSLIAFSVTGIDLDTIASYVDLARNSVEGPSFFSAGVEGLNLPCSNGESSRLSGSRASVCRPTNAFFGGVQAIPAPPAVWLLGTAVAGLVVRRLRSATVKSRPSLA